MDRENDLSLRDRLTRLETQVVELAKNYASQLYVQQHVADIKIAIERTETSIANMAKRFDEPTSKTQEQLATLFGLHSESLVRKAEQDERLAQEKLEQQRVIFQEKLEQERRLAAEKLAVVEEAKKAAKQRDFYVVLKERWQPMLALVGAAGTAGAALSGLFKWLIQHVSNVPK